MSETKHTPGPWTMTWDKYGKESEIHGKSELNDGPICIIPHDDVTESGAEEQLANARLIAAAPELLGALESLYAMVQGECPSLFLIYEDSGGDARLDIAVAAAIAKAKGEQP
jgi:hypothetical protein